MAGPLGAAVVAVVANRLAAVACGSLLQRLGATVVLLEPAGRARAREHATFACGAMSVAWEEGGDAQARAVLERADIVVMSSDAGPQPTASMQLAASTRPVRCDITALGCETRGFVDDAALQALAGWMDVTGLPDGPPVQVRFPAVELSGALYAAASTLLAWSTWLESGDAQRISPVLYDAAFNALATFLPAHLGGQTPKRIGNQHPLSAPWDAFRSDEWLLVCTVSDEQWRRLAALIAAPGLADDPRFASLPKRVEHRGEINRLVREWVAARRVDDLEKALLAAGIPCGRVVGLAAMAREPNVVHRGSIRVVEDREHGVRVAVPAGLLDADDWWAAGDGIPAVGEHTRVAAQAVRAIERARPGCRAPQDLPFKGLKVLEIGQYTTAPLVARHLASLGADVLKIEPPQGDTARAYVPSHDGVSLFFVITNCGKKSVRLDLTDAADRAMFGQLVDAADVLVENLKPHALAKLGFSAEELARRNPRLIYAAISGFGARSIHRGRPAYDTVIQAMSGVMDATRVADTPIKAGVSIADIAGGQMALLALLGALMERDATGRGRALDISMQDASAWFTQTRWQDDSEREGLQAVRSANGLELLHADGRRTPVRTVAQACASGITAARRLLRPVRDERGHEWTLLGSPLCLARGEPRVGQPTAANLSAAQALRWWTKESMNHVQAEKA